MIYAEKYGFLYRIDGSDDLNVGSFVGEKVFDRMPDFLWTDVSSTVFYLFNEDLDGFFGYEVDFEWTAVKLTLLHYLVLYWGMNGNLPSWYKGVRRSRCSLFTLIRLSEWVNTAHTVNFYPDRIIKKNRIVSYFHSREHSVDTVIPWIRRELIVR